MIRETAGPGVRDGRDRARITVGGSSNGRTTATGVQSVTDAPMAFGTEVSDGPAEEDIGRQEAVRMTHRPLC